MHATDTLAEAGRLMTVCNSCRYCEGLCAVFPAMEERRVFNDGDLNYLANLCHGCGACHIDCQFAPPHEFNVNVPATMARTRAESYAAYAWPPVMAGLFARNGLAVSLIAAASVAAFLAGFIVAGDPGALRAAHVEPGAFYALMPHGAMAALFGAAFIYALLALAMGVRAFWRDIGEPAATFAEPTSLWRAAREAGQLRYLDGAGVGCHVGEDRPSDRRRLFHHLTFYGFMLCFAATSVATLYHYAGREAPYPLYDLPVVLGVLGGLGMAIGSAGLWRARETADPALKDARAASMDRAFIAMLFCVAISGLAVLALRATGAMSLTLAAHLGFVFALFITMPYGKMVHGLYRFLALVRYAHEMRVAAGRPPGGEG
jgi:citrate/tricarballylate utilization protein